jgi:IMP dehydrogenase
LTPNRSRLDGDISTYVGPIKLEIPLISSPMDTVTEHPMAIAIGRAGGMGIVHRELSPSIQANHLRQIITARNDGRAGAGKIKVVPAAGITARERERVKFLYNEFGSEIDMFCLDTANGFTITMREMIQFVKDLTHGDIPIMAGNVAVGEGYRYLAEAGADAVRVGIGGGSICKTRIQTGFGVPTLSSILDCSAFQDNAVTRHLPGITPRDLYDPPGEKLSKVTIIADGGIRYPQDLAKSLAAGAGAVMCGSIFAGTKEAPGKEILTNDGKKWKEYRGMASEEVQIDRRGGLKEGTCAEGVSTLVAYKGSLARVLNDFAGGMRSSLTYANASNVEEFRKNARIIKITESGVRESHAFGTRK